MNENHNPLQLFQKWFYNAKETNEIEPNAMLLTTIGKDGYPKSRMVLLKKYTWEGFIFFTNLKSEKAESIKLNHKVSLQFNWINSKKTINIKGRAFKISEEISKNYFDIRPRGSKLGAWASKQSKTVNSRINLEQRILKFEKKFKEKQIPKPPYWGGFIIKPEEFIFIEKTKNKHNLHQKYSILPSYVWQKTTF